MDILIADDDSVFRKLIADILRQRGYHVIEAEDGQEALDIFLGNPTIVLCIIDVMMPRQDGWEVLKEIRTLSDVPILMLTALGEEHDEIKGLSYGANDYISKPFSFPIFTARIEALLRMAKKQRQGKTVVGELIMDVSNHKVWVEDREVTLNHKEFQLLNYLVLNRGVVLDRDKILNNLWGYDFDGDIRTVDAHVKMIRSKLGSCSNYIRTIRGTGYLFEVTYEKEHSEKPI